ncbi:hypothetical protein [Propionivibrio limicola]|uniref:hypothetical protein n=1 Tax=Propionivibrio limicola TaxID=167645 RepID=UPI0012918D9B|nr:hypothetical protein [Propionivibrio limicola]
MTPSSCSVPGSRRCRKSARDWGDPDWRHTLPAEWRDAVVAPLEFSVHRDYETAACRVLGFDEDGDACYYRHTYLLKSVCSDDGEEFYEAVVYGEEVKGWRLRDGRWLLWRVFHEDGDCHGNRGFYSFSEDFPR